MRRSARWAIFLSLALSASIEAQSNRPFGMAMTGIQAEPGGLLPYTNTPPKYKFSQLAPDVDYITILGEYYGIPFFEFSTTDQAPEKHPWTDTVTSLAKEAGESGKPIMLQLAFVRENVIGRATDDKGRLHVEQAWLDKCLDFSRPGNATVGRAYVNYVRWMTRTFKPAYLVTGVEINMYVARCGGPDTASWAALVDILNRAYDAAKEEKPDVVVFPSYLLETLYRDSLDGWDEAQFAGLSKLKKDRVGISTFPFGLLVNGEFVNPYMFPADYLIRIRLKHPTEPRFVLAETGWNSNSISVQFKGVCVEPLVYSHYSFAAAYLEFVLVSGYFGDFDLITWWSSRDLVESRIMERCATTAEPPDFAECGGDPWCREMNRARTNENKIWGPGFDELTYKAFGTMGVRTFDGTPKPDVFDLWRRNLAIPRRPPPAPTPSPAPAESRP